MINVGDNTKIDIINIQIQVWTYVYMCTYTNVFKSYKVFGNFDAVRTL